jgi:hypothetical protein
LGDTARFDHRAVGARPNIVNRPASIWRGVLLASLLASAFAASAVMTAADPGPSTTPASLADWPAPDLSGVARLASGCSAVLLEGERHLLGAAHCAGAIGMSATLASGEIVSIKGVALAPGWAGVVGVHDLAVMTLEQRATRSTGYALGGLDLVESMPAVLVAGYGGSGTPVVSKPAGTLSWGYNEYDASFTPPGQPTPASGHPIRLFDFDDGSFGANTLGLKPGGSSSLGLGPLEAMLAGMDSGGPSLVPVKLTGWRTWWPGSKTWEWRIAAVHVGIDGQRGGGFGGLGLDLLVGPHADWIRGAMVGP